MNAVVNKWMGTAFLNISKNWMLHTATHLFTKSVSGRISYIDYRGFWVRGVPKEAYTSFFNYF